MELALIKREIACLLLHMNAMRTNIKNVLKNNYGKKDGKEHLKIYDQVKELLKNEFKIIQDEEEEIEVVLPFDGKQVEMLLSFVCIYIEKLDAFLEETKTKNNKENEEQMELLLQVKKKIDQEKIEYV